MSTPPNRDLKRQNKANTVVRASIYLQISTDGMDKVCELTSEALKANPSGTSASTLEHILSITQACIECNKIAERDFTRCSTYVKTTASQIAKKENSYIKKAVKFNETKDLKEVMIHFEDKMLHFHRLFQGKSDSTQEVQIQRCTSPSDTSPITNTLQPEHISTIHTEGRSRFNTTVNPNLITPTTENGFISHCPAESNNTCTHNLVDPSHLP